MVFSPAFWKEHRTSSTSDDTVEYIHSDSYFLTISKKWDSAINNSAAYLRGDDITLLLDEIIEVFREKQKSFTLNLYDHDPQQVDPELLQSKGFSNPIKLYRMVSSIDTLLELDVTDKFDVKILSIDEVLQDEYIRVIYEIFPTYFDSMEHTREMVKARHETKQDEREITNFAAYSQSGKIVGTSAVMRAFALPEFVEFAGTSVLPEFRRQGIYTKFIRSRAEFARKQGATHTFVVARENTSAPILEKLGFQKVETITDWQYRIE